MKRFALILAAALAVSGLTGCATDPHEKVVIEAVNQESGVSTGFIAGDIVLLRGEDRQIIGSYVPVVAARFFPAEKSRVIVAELTESGEPRHSVLFIYLPAKDKPLKEYYFRPHENCVPAGESVAEINEDGSKCRLTNGKWISAE